MKLVRLSFLFLLCAAASLDAQWQLAPKPQAQFDVKSIFPQSPRLAVGAIDYGTMIHGGVFLTPDTGTTWKNVRKRRREGGVFASMVFFVVDRE